MTLPRPTRFFRLADSRAVQLAAPYPMPPLGDAVTVAVTEIGNNAEVDLMLPERWRDLRDGELRQLVAAGVQFEAPRRRGRG